MLSSVQPTGWSGKEGVRHWLSWGDSLMMKMKRCYKPTAKALGLIQWEVSVGLVAVMHSHGRGPPKAGRQAL